MKTVIPHEATVKIDFRLVPEQDPDDIFAKLRAHLDAQGFADVELARLGAMCQCECRRTTRWSSSAFARARRSTASLRWSSRWWAASSPVYAFAKPLGGIPVIRPGVGHYAGRTHAPDEHMLIENFANAAPHRADCGGIRQPISSVRTDRKT